MLWKNKTSLRPKKLREVEFSRPKSDRRTALRCKLIARKNCLACITNIALNQSMTETTLSTFF